MPPRARLALAPLRPLPPPPVRPVRVELRWPLAAPATGPCAVVLDTHLAQRSWLSGDDVTLADFAVAAPLMYSEAVRLPLAQYAHIQAWFARVRQLRAWQETDVELLPG